MAEQQKPVIVEDEDEQQETFSVQEKIDADELAIPKQEGTVEDLPTEDGVPRLDIAPIRVKPRPEAGVGVTDGQIQIRPEVKFKTLKDAAEKSLEEQQKPGTTYEDVISRLEKGETVKAGSLTLYPNEVEVVKTNKKMNTAVREAVAVDSFYKEKEASGEAPKEPGIAFTDPQRKEAIPLDDSLLNDASQDYAESRIRLNDHIKNKKLVDTGDSQVDVAVRQVFIDQFSTGSFFESLSQRLAEGGRGAVVLPGFAVEMTGSFVEAVRNKLRKGTPFLDEWASLESKRQERSKAYLEEIDRFLPAPTMAMAFNQDIRARFDKELEDGTITKEQHERLVFKRGISGDLIEREFVTEQQAYDLVEFAFTEMSELAQANVIAADFLLTGTSIAALQARGAKGVVQEVRKLRQEFDIPASVRLSSIPAYVQAADTKRKINTSLFEIGLQNQRLKTQTKFAKRRAAALEKEIPALEKQAQDALEAKDLAKRKELIKELEAKKSEAVNLRRKAFRNTISANVSPYVTSVAKDDLFLAGAAFAGSELLTGSMDRDMGEVSGLLAGLIFKKPATFVAKKAGKGAEGLVYTTGMRSMMPAVMQKMLRMDTTVDDFFRISGKESTYASRKAVYRVFKEIERIYRNMLTLKTKL